MAHLVEPLRFLDRGEMEAIHRTALRILDGIGIRVDHDAALDRLKSRGCRIDRAGRIARFSEETVEKSVAIMRRAYSDRGRKPARMPVRYSHVRFRSEPFRVHHDFSVSAGGFCCFILDLDGRRRPATMQDVRDALKLADALENITFTGLPVSAQEIPHAMRPVRMAAELARTTRKLGGIETFCVRDVEYVTRIAEVVAGGRDRLRENPVLVGYAEARSPLCIDANMAEIFMAYVEKGLPQTLDTMPNGGATAPAAAAGILALGAAETLAGVVLAHSIDENAVVGADINPSWADMRSGIFRYAGAERQPLLGARLQLLNEFYGCPAGVHGGKTDACVPGVQVGVEKAATMLMPVLCGAVGIGTVGHLENAITFSPEQLVIDNEIVGYVRRCLKGIDVNDETLAFDVIRDAGIGGNFLSHEHTAARFREEIHASPLFERSPWSSAFPQGGKGMQERARERARQLIAEDRPRPLSKEQEQAIDEIVKEAEREVGGQPSAMR